MNKIQRMRPMMGTFVEIGVLSDNSADVFHITDAFKLMAKIESLLCFYHPDSELSRLNRSGNKGLELHPISADVLRLALHMTGASQGAFNCTAGGALIHRGLLPDHGGPVSIAVGTEDDVVLNGCHARLLRPVRISLDGIAKGYAVDQAVALLKQRGIESGWVNAGGDIQVFGDVEQPLYRRESNGAMTYLGRFSNTSVATSSPYDYLHQSYPDMMLTTPALNDKSATWTVKAPWTWLADVLTKVAGVVTSAKASTSVALLGGELIYGMTT